MTQRLSANKTFLSIALAAIALSACGGGDDGQSPEDQATRFVPGDAFETELSLDGVLTETTTYRLYGIGKTGQLVSNSRDDLASAALIPIEVQRVNAGSKSSKVMPDVDAIQRFFPLLWAELSRRHGTQDAARIAQEVGDLDISLPSIFDNYSNSGLSLAEFVDFYEALDTHPELNQNALVESDLSNFLSNAAVTPRQLLDALAAQGSNWAELLTLMAARRDTFNSLYEQYQRSSATISDFLSAYRNNTLQADDKTSPLDVAKFVWQVIKDNKPETVATGAFTRVLSSQDKNEENYDGVKSSSSKVVELKATGLLPLVVIFRTKFALTGYHNGRHSTIGGQWLPLLNLDVKEMYAVATWKLNATARVTMPVNMGTVAAPIPEMPVFMEINQAGLFQNYTDKYAFRANGATGFSYIP